MINSWESHADCNLSPCSRLSIYKQFIYDGTFLWLKVPSFLLFSYFKDGQYIFLFFLVLQNPVHSLSVLNVAFLKTTVSFVSTEVRCSLCPPPLKASVFQEILNLFYLQWNVSSYLLASVCVQCLTTFNLLNIRLLQERHQMFLPCGDKFIVHFPRNQLFLVLSLNWKCTPWDFVHSSLLF